MWIWSWYVGLAGELRTLIASVLSSVIGAAIGALIKWIFDRRLIRTLIDELDAARRERKDALAELGAALQELALREAEARVKEEQLGALQRELDRVKRGVDEEKSKLEQLLSTLRNNETGIWTTFPKRPPFEAFDARLGERKPLVLTIANNKGGVGKTTLAGNLIAHFDAGRKMRVLAIDLDYQGSLSTMLRGELGKAEERKSYVNGLLERGSSIGTAYEATRRLGSRLHRSEIAPAFYELALFEDRLLVEWLLQAGGDDVRYRLANVLHNTAIRNKFDIVVIDVPPRLTTGTINALCASTHVLVPTIFNPIAAEPVANFLSASTLLTDELNPKVEFIGVVETMTPPRGTGERSRAEGRRMIQEALDRSFPTIKILETNVPRRTAISEGGVAYFEDRAARSIFDALGSELGGRMGCR